LAIAGFLDAPSASSYPLGQHLEDLVGQNGLLKQLTKALVERALQAEFTSTSIGNRIPLVASIAFQAFSVKVLKIVEQAA
jgi:hypothetical protein